MAKSLLYSINIFLILILLFSSYYSGMVFAQEPPEDPNTPWTPPEPTGTPRKGEIVTVEPTLIPPVPGGYLTAWTMDYQFNRKDSFSKGESIYFILICSSASYLLCWYEYYPAGSIPPGHWMERPWSGPYSGSIGFGPLTPEPAEPYGQHAERFWIFDIPSRTIYEAIARWNYEKPEPEKIPTQSSISVSQSNIDPGQQIIITASVNPAPPGGTLVIQSNQGGGTWAPIQSDSATSGSISTSWSTTNPGTCLFQAVYSGYLDANSNKEYMSSQSSAQTVKIQLIKTTLSLMISRTNVYIDALTGSSGPVEISGILSPAEAGGLITLTYSTPEGTTYTTVIAGPGGIFADSFTPNSAGNYQITANYQGDQTHEASMSQTVSLTVNKNWSTFMVIIGILIVAGALFLFYRQKRIR
jgi:hypothetical protein